ncbi:MAG: sulfite exporter TauE/SafE family protein [Kiloniellales bacterium]|nr:sulfite exporter TauE/SafE family protein [Kiloniellales bacterium]
MDLGLPLGDLLLLAGVLLATGAAVGLLAGLLGIGGGGILVPVLFEVFRAVGVDPALCIHLAVGTSLSVIIPTSLRSFRSHRAKGAVDTALIKAMALPVVAGVLLGVLVARYADDTALKAVWAGCASLMSAKLFFARQSWRLGEAIPGNPGRALFGGFVGLVSTLMSIGGGAFITSFMTLYGRPIHQGVATGSGFGPIIAIPATLGFVWAGWQAAGLPPGSLGYVNLLGTAVIVPASVLAAPLGVRIAHGISRRKLELAFATFLAVVAARFFVSLLG